jgi:hypothetical protein
LQEKIVRLRQQYEQLQQFAEYHCPEALGQHLNTFPHRRKPSSKFPDQLTMRKWPISLSQLENQVVMCPENNGSETVKHGQALTPRLLVENPDWKIQESDGCGLDRIFGFDKEGKSSKVQSLIIWMLNTTQILSLDLE